MNHACSTLHPSPQELADARHRLENHVHSVRDTAWREGPSKIRTGATPRVIASLWNAVLGSWPETPAAHCGRVADGRVTPKPGS